MVLGGELVKIRVRLGTEFCRRVPGLPPRANNVDLFDDGCGSSVWRVAWIFRSGRHRYERTGSDNYTGERINLAGASHWSPLFLSFILSVSLCRKAGHGKLMFYGGPVLRTIGLVGFGVMNLPRSGGVAEGHLQHG